MKSVVYVMGILAFSTAGMFAAETLVNENFENVANSDVFAKVSFKVDCLKECARGSGGNPIAGGASAQFDGSALKAGWQEWLTYPADLALEDGYYYQISFKYRFETSLKAKLDWSGNSLLLILRYNEGKSVKTKPLSAFAYYCPESGEAKALAVVPRGMAGARIVLGSKNVSSLVIDDLQIERAKIPEKAAWLLGNPEEAFPGMAIVPFSAEKWVVDINSPMLYKSREEFFPIVDKYGQFIYAQNPVNKITCDADFQKRIEEENAFNAKLRPFKGRDAFGGLLDAARKYPVTGRFYTRKVDGKWFFVTPEGNLFWSFGITAVMLQSDSPFTDREYMFQDVSNKNYMRGGLGTHRFYKDKKFQTYFFSWQNLDKKYGSDYFKKCGAVCAERMLKWGINTAGGWSMPQVLETRKVPYVYMIDSSKRMSLDSKYEGLKEHWHRMFDFFDPNFETGTLEIAKRAATYINSPMCIGVFVDNEISWQKAPLMMPKAALTTPATQPAKLEFLRQLKDKYKDVSALNTAWKAEYKSWDDFLARRDFVPTEKSAEPDLLAFEKSYYERYFSVCRKAVKAVNEGALYCGCRFAWTNDFCVSVSSRFCDVVSFNIYASEISQKRLPEGSEDKPIVIGEFNFGNFEGNPRGGCVPRGTLEGQLRGYEEYTLSALENPSVAGIHWFRWMEQCVSGRSDGENFVTGFVDICDTPIYPMVLTARKLSRNLYNIRLSGSTLTKSGVSGEWRTDQH